MDEQIILKAVTCNYSDTHGEYGCNNINLKLPKSDVAKLQTSVVSQNQLVPDIDYSAAAQFWGLAFTTTFFLWLFARGIGEIIKYVKNA